jgi:hypothetical protein
MAEELVSIKINVKFNRDQFFSLMATYKDIEQMMKKFFTAIILAPSFLMLASCTWVKLTTEGENVAILTADEVKNCTQTGTTTVEVVDRAVLERNEDKVATELRTMARNRAADRGDAIVPSTRVVDGEQTFTIYRCRG